MCRQLAYVGVPTDLAELVYTAPHSLLVQSYAPRDMRSGGHVNVDGFGIGWFEGPGSTAVRYRRPVPIWQDDSVRTLATGLPVTGAVAAVRAATPGMGVSEAACAPFTDGRWLFSLNGRVDGWPATASALAETLPVTDLLTLDAPTDAALLWAVIRHRLTLGVEPADALGSTIDDVVRSAPGSWLTTLLTDGVSVFATTYRHALWSRIDDRAVTLASEPFDDDPAWQELADGQLFRGAASPDAPAWLAGAALGSARRADGPVAVR